MTADTTVSGAEPRAFVLLKSRRRLDLLNPDPARLDFTTIDLADKLFRRADEGFAPTPRDDADLTRERDNGHFAVLAPR
jgi:hypothetical protein